MTADDVSTRVVPVPGGGFVPERWASLVSQASGGQAAPVKKAGRPRALGVRNETRCVLFAQTVLLLVEMVSPLCVRPRGRGVLGLYLRGVPVLLMTRAAPSVLLLVVLGAVQQEAGGHAARGDPSFTVGRPARGEQQQEAEMGGGGGARTVSRGGGGGKLVTSVDQICD